MVTIVTQNSRYPIEEIPLLEQEPVKAIRVKPGQAGERVCAIMGCYNPKEHQLDITAKTIVWDGRPVGLDELAGYLAPDIKPGTFVVGRMLEDSASTGHEMCLVDEKEARNYSPLFRTSLVREVQP